MDYSSQGEAEAKPKAEAEARAEEAARQRAAAAAINQYTALIHDRVRRNWSLPDNWRGLSCVVRVNLIPGGDVASVRIVQSSGDPVFDRSVMSAISHAARLPVPPEPHLFEAFREFNFRFDPIKSCPSVP